MQAGAQPDVFQGRGGFVKLGHFDKHFDKHFLQNQEKKPRAGERFGVFVFSARYS